MHYKLHDWRSIKVFSISENKKLIWNRCVESLRAAERLISSFLKKKPFEFNNEVTSHVYFLDFERPSQVYTVQFKAITKVRLEAAEIPFSFSLFRFLN